MCCDGWVLEVEEGDEEGKCPDCGTDTVGGGARTGCNYSPEVCHTCGWRPCDDSC